MNHSQPARTDPSAMDDSDSLDEAVLRHDQKIAESGLQLWMGAEPTFTRPETNAAEWRTLALGIEKEQVGRRFMQVLASEAPGAVVLRTLGRQYPGESKPRWNYGIYSRRDGTPIWRGAKDPVTAQNSDISARIHQSQGQAIAAQSPEHENRDELLRCKELQTALGFALQAAGLHTNYELLSDPRETRFLFSADAELLHGDWNQDPCVARPRLDSVPIPVDGWRDELAARGIYLVAIGLCETEFTCDKNSLQVELPAFGSVADWLRFLEFLGDASVKAGLKSLVLTGFPPPVDQHVAWTTVTPDPGVLEINMAPCASMLEFLTTQRKLHAAAAFVGLSAFQLLFNGEVVDSGGGQHLTFGGPSPEASPFLLRPHLLPRLVTCLNHHPSLSYWFAVRAVGSCGQQPRPDEVSPESLDGLSVAVDRLFQSTSVPPESLWRSVAPFLCDRFGNTHRCEINVEKLWNTLNSERGCLGLVELRAFRMTRSPEDAAAIAMFMQTLIVWLAERDDAPNLVEWGSRLHDRFSLPYFLQQDLSEVLTQMQAAGFPLPPTVTQRLLDDSLLVLGEFDLGNAQLIVRQAIEFWPVVGDLSANDRSFRLMDSSTQRVEILVRVPRENGTPATVSEIPWRLTLMGFEVPWVVVEEHDCSALVRGVRYKAFHPQMTVSPLVEAIDPLEFFLTSADDSTTWRVRLHSWRPDVEPYDGQPKDFEEARRRRNERLVVEQVTEPIVSVPIASSKLSKHCIDLRRRTIRHV